MNVSVGLFFSNDGLLPPSSNVATTASSPPTGAAACSESPPPPGAAACREPPGASGGVPWTPPSTVVGGAGRPLLPPRARTDESSFGSGRPELACPVTTVVIFPSLPPLAPLPPLVLPP